MKKRLLILVGFLLYFTIIQAQDKQQSEHKLFVGAAASSNLDDIQPPDDAPKINLQFQIGGALLFKEKASITSPTDNDVKNMSFGFPYSVLYIPPTFISDKFEVSKGYFSNGVHINWQIGANQDVITSIDIYRRELKNSITSPFELIASVGKDTFSYIDAQVEGGVLFEYQIRATGVPTGGAAGAIGQRTQNYMDGIGFRNPTATVSGGITYEGGSPVQDVIVFAEPIGAENRAAKSLEVSTISPASNGGTAKISDIANLPADAVTFQFWLANDARVFEYKLSSDNDNYVIYTGANGSRNLQINVLQNGVSLGEILLRNRYPTGEIDAAGNDIFKDNSSIDDLTFNHYSIVLRNNEVPKYYINGREINEDYITYARSLGENTMILSDTRANNDLELFSVPDNTVIEEIALGTNYSNFKMDEIRVWSRALEEAEIRRDYRRYLGGGENGLAIYLRMDEGAGNFLYDLSKVGFKQNKNDAEITRHTNNPTIFSDDRPTQKQLGVFGVTDQNGSYIISGVGYKGTGESFVISPSLGVHKFEPASQTVFLGTEAPVVNQLNFTDISSFKFNGKVVYNVQDVFNPIATTSPTNLKDYGYNKYILGNTIINKGEYYYEGGSVNASGFYEGGSLKQYPVIGVEGANVLVDGNIVFDADNQPILTDENGNFTVNVPIGNHKVEVEKNGHTFELKGRFPETNTFEFFEDQIETQYFIDNTRVTLVGRVVGGKREFEKPIGFGVNGLFEVISNEDENNEVTETVSSINNIGVAQITFKGDVNSSNLDKIITTNPETGEYKVALVPYIYSIENSGIIIPSNTTITNLLTSTETLDLREIPDLQKSEFTAEDNKVYESESYQYEKSFRYNAPVSLTLLEQEHEQEFTIGENTFDLSDLAIPLYIQKENYFIDFEVAQQYVNKDGSEDVITKEFYTEGNFNINNNLEISGRSSLNYNSSENKYRYVFFAGTPNISGNFQQSISVEYTLPNGTTVQLPSDSGFKSKGIIKGGKANSGVSFATTAPERPDIILRDPPGSNSFASIERGSKITYTEEFSNASTSTSTKGVYVSLAPTFTISTGFVSVFTDAETNIVNDLDATFTKSSTTTSNNTTSNTYQFNQTISTSGEIEFVGAEGDLYIGNAKNVYYGVFDNMFITEDAPPATETDGTTTIERISLNVKDEEGSPKTIYISVQKDIIIGEQPTNTFFTYSQKYIVETLIPDLERLAALAATPDQVTDNFFPAKTKGFYTKQAQLWKKVIEGNEKAKYDAFTLKNSVRNRLNAEIDATFGSFKDAVKGIVFDNFFTNRSFDAGLGEFTDSVTILNASSVTSEVTTELSSDAKQQLGLLVNNVGLVGTFQSTKSKVDTDLFTSEKEFSTTISYTLKDNDRNNALSVDIINLFDGNGPIFATRGGATSCPYEGETTSIFYDSSNHDPYDFTAIGNGGESLSDATNKVYAPEISSDKVLITNVSESEAAIFKLKLKNVSETQSDLEFVLDVDPLTLNGATTNIEANGLTIFLPYNEEIEFPLEITKSSSSSVFRYDNIRVFLSSPCDILKAESEDFIDLSVEFKKSCSNVALSSPENNWIFNNNEAFSSDINGNITTNSLPITFTDFNTDFTGFEKIELQYKSVNSSNWQNFETYYGSAGDSDGIVIQSSDLEFTYNWDIVGNNIPDGDYEFRAVSFCADNITNTSEIISGTVNLNAPLVFGTPKPSDGILDVGEDISVRFNEPIFNRATTSINVTGLQNQQEIDHSVSVFLDGSQNQIELPNQRLGRASFTLQFWLDSNTTGKGVLVSQEDGMQVEIDGKNLIFSVGGQSISTETVNKPINDSQYNFYSFVYQNGANPQLLIMENGEILEEESLQEELDINTNASIFIGGQNVLGNLHDVRLWSRPFTAAQATLAKDVTLTGREVNLLGYWKLDEGFGNVGLDKAKRKNAIVNLDWAILPSGTGYEFKNNEYLTLDKVGFVQPTNFEDITLSFWIKPNATSSGTIFSNGRGNDDEIVATNGFRNKWSVNLKTDGHLELVTENISYKLTTNTLPRNNWTHVAIVRKIGGTLNSYIDGQEQSSVSAVKTGGFSGNKILVGARLYEDISNNEIQENHFTGLLDEIRFWNTARSLAQIQRDRYFEIASNTEGLILKLDFNEDANNTVNGPTYERLNVRGNGQAGLEMQATVSILSAGATQSYTQDAPPLKPELKFTNIPFTTVINGDEMIITPNLTEEEWSLFEGEIINFSVARLSDTHFNTQQSPITWSALVNRQELEWFTEDQTKEISTEKILGETYSFTMDVVNIGGSNQPYAISGLPTWMQVSVNNGSIAPDSSREITFTVDKDLAMGTYTADIFLETASGFNDRLSFNLRVINEAPNWAVNAADYSYSMNFIGKIQIDGIFSRDEYTKVGAFVDDIPRGEAYLKYDEAFDSYFVFLTAYSNIETDVNGNLPIEKVTFKIWDAINGKIIAAAMDNVATVDFMINGIEGAKSRPKVFSTTALAEQNLALNKGWTWVSLFADDSNLSDINQTLSILNPEEGDGIKSQTLFANFESGFWNGNLSSLSVTEMYKIKLKKAGDLRLLGPEISPANFNISINGTSTSLDGKTPQWNWLSFPIHRDISLQEAFAFYIPTDGDVIKDQFNFAIYDATSGWSGTLNYLQSGKGYMLNASETQTFNYPDANVLFKTAAGKIARKTQTDTNNFAQYSSNMNIVAEVVADEYFTKVLVYDAKNVLRGVANVVDFNSKRISFITAFSNTEDNLKFVLANDFGEIDINKNFIFKDNLVLGDLKNPVQLSAKALSLEDVILTDAVVYPNPFTNQITIDFSKEKLEFSKVEIFNTIGVRLLSKTVNFKQKTTINTNSLAKGIYLIRLTDSVGKSVVKKMIKE